MAQGCDLFFAEAVLDLRRSCPEIRLEALLPCPDQADGWHTSARQRYEFLCSQCDSCEVLEPIYSSGCMLRRNQTMVERAQVLISVYDGSAGGTGNTVHYARRLGLRILPVWL